MKVFFLALVVGLVALGLIFAFNTDKVSALDDTGCQACHGASGLTKTTPQEGRTSLYVDGEALDSSVHQALDCITCHGNFSVQKLPHPASTITPLTKQSLALKCGSCHSNEYRSYQESTHAEGLALGDNNVATCTDCHSSTGNAHSIGGASDPDSPVFKGNIAETCATCHADSGLMGEYDISAAVYDDYISSAHGGTLQLAPDDIATCTSCHGNHEIVSLDSFNLSIAENCASCHSDQANQYLGSIHGEGFKEGDTNAPVCGSCHSPTGIAHSIATVSEYEPLFRKNIASETCATAACHDNAGLMAQYDISAAVLETYNNFFHGKAMKLATDEQIDEKQYATCTSCHGNHDILSADDPASSVGTLSNLATTCRQCHDEATTSFADSFHKHQEAEANWLGVPIVMGNQLPASIAEFAYTRLIIPGLVLFAISFVVLDLFRLFVDRRKQRKTK